MLTPFFYTPEQESDIIWLGGGGAELDYKVVLAHPDFEAVGTGFDMFVNGSGRNVSMDIFGNIGECDDARVYMTKSLRSAKIRE